MSCDKGNFFWGDGTYENPGAFGGCHEKKDSKGTVVKETYYNWTTIIMTILLCILCMCCLSVSLYALTQSSSQPY